METAWLPDYLYYDGRLISGAAVVCDSSGRIGRISESAEDLRSAGRLGGRALLPGLVNAHSHSFQRAIRGRTEHGAAASHDTFWTWREAMYRAAWKLSPEDIYDAARMAFMEMLLSGITTVGEFHYLHHQADGAPYSERSLLAEQVVRAAREVGVRIALQRAAYARAGFNQPPNPLQARFLTPRAEDFIEDTEALCASLGRRYSSDEAWVSVAPHSIRAIPLDYLTQVVGYAREHRLKIHMHAAEQPAEIGACEAEYGARPIALLRREDILDPSFTAIHAIHISDSEIEDFRETGAKVCACPTTERNLGDGIGPADRLSEQGVEICFGSDSNVQIDLLEDARQLEYHLRLKLLRRAVLAPGALFHNATANGAESVGAPSGAADFFAVDLNDPSIAGAGRDALLTNIVFGAGRAAIREVFVAGRPVVEQGRHPLQQEIAARFQAVQAKLWSGS